MSSISAVLLSLILSLSLVAAALAVVRALTSPKAFFKLSDAAEDGDRKSQAVIYAQILGYGVFIFGGIQSALWVAPEAVRMPIGMLASAYGAIPLSYAVRRLAVLGREKKSQGAQIE